MSTKSNTSVSGSNLDVYINTTVTTNQSGLTFTDSTNVVGALETEPVGSISLPKGTAAAVYTTATQDTSTTTPQVVL